MLCYLLELEDGVEVHVLHPLDAVEDRGIIKVSRFTTCCTFKSERRNLIGTTVGTRRLLIPTMMPSTR